MSRATDKDTIKAERTAQRKQDKRQRKATFKAKREADQEAVWWQTLRDAGITFGGKRTTGDIAERVAKRKRYEEAKRNFNRQADELAAQVKAVIEADRAAGRETDLWEWLQGAPCVVTKALRERGISLGKRKR